MRQLRCIAGIFLWPRQAFHQVLACQRAVAAVAVLLLALEAAHWATCQRIDIPALVRQTAERLAMRQGAAETWDADIEEQAVRRLNMRRIAGYVLIAGVVPLSLGILAAVFWLAARSIKDRATLGICYRLAAHAVLPVALRELLALPVVLSYPGIDPERPYRLFRTDLGLLVGDGLPGIFLVDVFSIWTGILAATAMGALGLDRGRRWVVGLVVWLLVGFASQRLA